MYTTTKKYMNNDKRHVWTAKSNEILEIMLSDNTVNSGLFFATYYRSSNLSDQLDNLWSDFLQELNPKIRRIIA